MTLKHVGKSVLKALLIVSVMIGISAISGGWISKGFKNVWTWMTSRNSTDRDRSLSTLEGIKLDNKSAVRMGIPFATFDFSSLGQNKLDHIDSGWSSYDVKIGQVDINLLTCVHLSPKDHEGFADSLPDAPKDGWPPGTSVQICAYGKYEGRPVIATLRGPWEDVLNATRLFEVKHIVPKK